MHKHGGKCSGSRIGSIAGIIAAAAIGSACTFLYFPEDAKQCTTTDDCRSRGGVFANSTCGPDNTCVPGNGVVCTTNRQCLDAFGGQPYTCRKSDGICVPLLTAECNRLLADPEDLANDGAILIGAVHSLTTANSVIGIPQIDSIELARRDFKNTAAGLPPAPGQSSRRPLVFIGCDDQTDYLKAITHLVNDVHVPALIGPTNSGFVIKAASTITIPSGTFLMTATATSNFITTLDDHGLVWRTAPNDTLLGRTTSNLLTSFVEPALTGPSGVTKPGSLRVALANKGDGFGQGLAAALSSTLVVNGKSVSDPANQAYYKQSDYGDPTQPGADARYASTVAALLDFKPHVVIIVGTAEGALDIFQPLEAAWPSTESFRPQYIFAGGTQTTELVNAVSTNAELRHRILGVIAGTTGDLFQKYAIRYKASFTEGRPYQYPAAAFDAAYVISLAIASLRDAPITGANIAQAISKLVPGPGTTPIDVGPEQLNTALSILAQGGAIDLNGASGPLNFDLKTGDTETDIQTYCVDIDGQGKAIGYKNTGYFYNAQTNAMQGSIVCP